MKLLRWPRPSFLFRRLSSREWWVEIMKANELRTKGVDELNKELLDLLKAQFGLRMQIATQQLSNNSQIGKVRRDIARVRTLLREKAVKQ